MWGSSVASSPYRYTPLGLGLVLVFMIQSLKIEVGVQVFGTRDEEGQDEVCKPDAKEQEKAMQVSGFGFRVWGLGVSGQGRGLKVEALPTGTSVASSPYRYTPLMHES